MNSSRQKTSLNNKKDKINATLQAIKTPFLF
jgi:hypothetical protein